RAARIRQEITLVFGGAAVVLRSCRREGFRSRGIDFARAGGQCGGREQQRNRKCRDEISYAHMVGLPIHQDAWYCCLPALPISAVCRKPTPQRAQQNPDRRQRPKGRLPSCRSVRDEPGASDAPFQTNQWQSRDGWLGGPHCERRALPEIAAPAPKTCTTGHRHRRGKPNSRTVPSRLGRWPAVVATRSLL